MGPPVFPFSLLLRAILTITILCSSSSSVAQEDHHYTVCRSPYRCGPLENVEYPFWGGENRPGFCGRPGYELKCVNDLYSIVNVGNQSFRVLGVIQSRLTIQFARLDLWDDVCLERFANTTTFNGTPFSPRPPTQYLSIFYGCPAYIHLPPPNNFSCAVNGSVRTSFYQNRTLPMSNPTNLSQCIARVDVPMRRAALKGLYGGTLPLKDALNEGFDLDYVESETEACSACRTSGGVCGWNASWSELSCLCPDGPWPRVCPSSASGTRRKNWVLKTIIAIGAVGGFIFTAFMISCCFRRWRSYCSTIFFWKKRSIDQQNIEAFIESHGFIPSERWSYKQIRQMTNSFDNKLGQGGYGSVFKGNLPNGDPVAVKVLSESKGNGEEFINEVASISRTSHVNIVTLMGFCFEGSKRALVYEFMPNGSLEKFIYKDGQHLGWEKLHQIAVGIARGLEYLHQGCNTRILHFDIKPHNILLDEDFCPKISDFGLSKLSSRKQSTVSMADARGTIGYIAPEVFSRNFGEVSHKSDVYSYGMMVLEMVGGGQNFNSKADNTSEMYFPHWIYRRVELGEDLGLPGDRSKEDNEVARKLILVGLWCIQTDPTLRPCMTDVLDMLGGRLEALKVPPKPFYLSSPNRSSVSSFTASHSLL